MAALNWDFNLAREFSKCFRSGSDDTTSSVAQCARHNVPKGLGDFEHIFEFLGYRTVPEDINANIRHEVTDSASSQPSSYSTAASSEPVENFDDFINHAKASKGVRWKDDINGKALTKCSRRRSRPSDIDPTAIVQLLRNDPETASDADPAATVLPLDGIFGKADILLGPRVSAVNLIKPGLIPSSVAFSSKSYEPPPPPVPFHCVDPTIIRPIYNLTANEQKARLIKKIIKRFPDPTSLLQTDPGLAISHIGGVTDFIRGIHVFVDFSNIEIGFYNRLKAVRNIHERARVKQPPISYHSLALLLERGRSVARRILVGSTTRYLPTHTPRKPPKHFHEASMCRYELNILERVCKPRSSTPIQKMKNGTGNGYATATSGQESGSESAAFGELKRPIMAEQAVDEILQMKLLESLVDTAKPTTIVLASGDAAEAEYSGGFLKNVERALMKGWRVEIVAWRDGLSKEYRNKEFLKRWEGKIKIIELDNFCEELLAVYTSSVSGIFPAGPLLYN